jgi:protein-disulfide isomerase
MKKLSLSVAAACGLLLFSAGAWAQRTKPAARPAPKPPPAAKPTPANANASPTAGNTAPPVDKGPALATVGGQPVNAGDLGPDVVKALAGEAANLSALRRESLERLINTYLLEEEAAKRKITLDALLDTEIINKVQEPSESQLQAIYQANQSQFNGQSYYAVRGQLINYLKQQQAAQLESDLAGRLRATASVTLGADVNAPNLAPTAVLATAAGRNITAGEFNAKVAPLIYRERLALWGAVMDALEVKINDLLLIAEAKKRNLSPEELLQKEVNEKLTAPTDAEITKFYNDNKTPESAPLEQARAQLSDILMQQKRRQLEFDLVTRLRAGSAVQIVLPEPEPPVVNVSVDDDPARGPANAPVTIVVFTDFQCPTCARVHPVLDGVASEFGDKVRLVVRDFPLAMHKDARKAAEAANAAHAQGKFFDYIALLYKNQDKEDVASLKGYAAALGLDRARFDAELDGGKYAAEVEKDVQDGISYGIQGTPTIFVNGVRLEDLSSEAMRAAVQKALQKASKTD